MVNSCSRSLTAIRINRRPVGCTLKNAQGKSITKVKDAVTHGDYLVFHDSVTLRLPRGHYFFTMDQGPESLVRTGKFEIQTICRRYTHGRSETLCQVERRRLVRRDLDAARPVAELPLLMQAENLTLLEATDLEQ